MRVIVVGGGAIGLSSAFFLSDAGVSDVIVLEGQSALGSGSTGRNPGAIRTGFGSRINMEMTIASKRIMAEFEDLTGAVLEFENHGYLWMASTEEQANGLRAVVSSLKDRGIRVSWLSPADVLELVPAVDPSRIIGASFAPEDGLVEPHQMLNGFVQGAVKGGVAIKCGYPVTGLKIHHQTVSGIESPQGDLEADAVLIAAGAHSGVLAAGAGIEVPLESFRRHSFVSGPAEWLKAPMPFVVDSETGAYFRQSGSCLLFGRGREYEEDRPTFSTNVKPAAMDLAVAAACRVIPAMCQTTVMHGYAGLYAMTPDLHAILGPVESISGLYLACGFSGHGLMHAPVTGRLLAEWIRDGNPSTLDAKPLMLRRFEQGETISETFQI